MPLQEGGSGWKFPWGVTRYEAAWGYPISTHRDVQKLNDEVDCLATRAVSEEKARQGMDCFLAMEVAGHRCQKQLCKVCPEPQPPADTRDWGQIRQTQFQTTLYQLPSESKSHGKVISAKFPDSPNLFPVILSLTFQMAFSLVSRTAYGRKVVSAGKFMQIVLAWKKFVGFNRTPLEALNSF